MQHVRLHSWDVSREEAIALQNSLRDRLSFRDDGGEITTVAGLDVSYDRGSDLMFAGIVTLRLPGLSVVETATAALRVSFPYIPGLLSFRESPAVLAAWGRLTVTPDCLICDGQGLAHPRRFGIACHLGLLCEQQSLGCAKSLLVGTYREPGRTRGSAVPLVDKGETVGMIVRTKDGVEPVFVSVGHRISLERAVEVVLRCTTTYRLPEPTRRAHLLVNEERRRAGSAPGQPSLF